MDYVMDEFYLTLSTRAKKMFTVVEHARAYHDNDRCLKNQFFHAVKSLAKLAELSRPHAVYALKEIEQKGIIIRQHRHAHSTLYTYIPPENNPIFLDFIKNMKVTLRNHQTVTLRNHQTVTLRNHRTTVPEQIQITTTQINVKKYNDMVLEYSKEAVDAVVESIRNRNGKIRNPTGQLIHALRNGYNPKTPEQIAQEKRKERKAQSDLESEKRSEEFENWKTEATDPEIAKKTIADIIGKFAT